MTERSETRSGALDAAGRRSYTVVRAVPGRSGPPLDGPSR